MDLDPEALRWAWAVDSEALRQKSNPGELYFSVEGPALQEGLGWDFDGDYYIVISHPTLVPAVFVYDVPWRGNGRVTTLHQRISAEETGISRPCDFVLGRNDIQSVTL